MHYTQVRLARIIEGSLKSLQSRKTQFPVSQNADAAHYRQIMRRQSWWELPISRILGSFALFSPISSEKKLKLNHPIPSIQVTFSGQAFEGWWKKIVCLFEPHWFDVPLLFFYFSCISCEQGESRKMLCSRQKCVTEKQLWFILKRCQEREHKK